jgi:hypothetical protein
VQASSLLALDVQNGTNVLALSNSAGLATYAGLNVTYAAGHSSSAAPVRLVSLGRSANDSVSFYGSRSFSFFPTGVAPGSVDVSACFRGAQLPPLLPSIAINMPPSCLAYDGCGSSPCSAPGTLLCQNFQNFYQCQCNVGFQGTLCQTNLNVSARFAWLLQRCVILLILAAAVQECASSPCSNGATCVDGVNSFTCNCVPGFIGANCQTEVNECASAPCANGATCVDQVNSYRCVCLPGYGGVNCQTDINECGSSVCLHPF